MTNEQAAGPFGTFAGLIEAIELFDPQAEEHLYSLFNTILRFQLAGQIEAEYLADTLHAAFLDALIAIRRGEVRNPEALMAFCHTVTHRKLARHIAERVNIRQHGAPPANAIDPSNPEADRLLHEQQALIRASLQTLSPLYREVLVRYYLHEESRDQICEAMDLTVRQFVNLKSRARTQLQIRMRRHIRFGELRRRIAFYGEKLAA